MVRYAAVAAAYLAGAKVGLWFSLYQGTVTPVWLPAGIGLAAVLLYGPRMLWVVAGGELAANMMGGVSLVAALIMTTGSTLGTAVGATLLRCGFGFPHPLTQPRDVLGLAMLGAFVAPVIAASAAAVALHFASSMDAGRLSAASVIWWVGDALGVIVVAPILLCWLGGRADHERRIWQRRAVLLAGLQAVVTLFVFTAPPGGPLNGATAYLVLGVAALLALHLPMRWITVQNAGVFVVSTLGTLAERGPFGASASAGMADLQTHNVVFCLTTLLVGALASERRRMEAQHREAAERFRRLAGLSSDWYWEQDENLRFSFISDSYEHKAGLPAEEILGKTRFELGNVFDSEPQRRRHEEDLAARREFRDLQLARYAPNGERHYVSISGEPIFDQGGRFRGYRGVGRVITRERSAREAVHESEGRLRSLVTLSADWIWEQDEALRYTYVSADSAAKGAMQPAALLGKTRAELPLEWESEQVRRTHEDGLAARRPFRDLRLRHVDESGNASFIQVSGEPIFDEGGCFRGYRGVGRDTTQVVQAEDSLKASEERFRALTAVSSDWYWEQDASLRFARFDGPPDNPDVAYFQAHNLGKTRWEIGYEGFSAQQWEKHRAILDAHLPFRDLEIGTLDTSRGRRYVLLSGEPMFDARGRFVGYRGTGKDITERKLAQARIARLKDMYAAMTEAGDAIIHSKDTQQLFEAICRIAVEYGHFVFARIAMIDAKTGWAQNTAMAGDDQGYVQRLVISVDPTRPEGQGPSGDAIRSGKSYVCNDIDLEPRVGAWRNALSALGVRAQATFLLRREGQVVGTLHLYADQIGFFDEELVTLLDKLAANLSFALDNYTRDEARRAAETALRDSETRFRDFANAAGEYVWEADLEGRITYVSSRIQSVWGYSDQELIGHSPGDFMPPTEFERVREWLAQNLAPDGSFRDLEHRILTKQNEVRWLLVNAVGVFEDSGRRIGQRGTGRDITDRKAAEARISYLATRDPLTELPNRVLFNDRLEQGIVTARRSGQSLALLFIDLDRFKYINDSLGHEVGDLLLKEVAQRMQACIRKGDTLSRLGGDEFVVTLEGLQHAEDAAQVATKIIKALSRPVDIVGYSLSTSCSIGISIFPLDADDERTLMKNADTAMYHAKEKGRNNYQFFSPEMNVRAVERHNLETALRLGLERSEFALFFQPQVDIRSGRVVGVEALLRWHHPERGLLLPATFIGVAEESGLIEPIGQWALRSACQRAKAWQEAGYPPLKVAVNISARQLNKPRDFGRSLTRTLSSTGLDPQYLELEMTESLLLHNAEENIAMLRKLGKDGVRIAVDDFGTGYSSLAYLRQLPIDTLKIDRGFVRDIETDPEDAFIIEAIVAMGHSLRLQVTAEGVETRGQLQALERLGCDEYQGYLFSKPLPPVELAARFLAPGLDFEASTADA